MSTNEEKVAASTGDNGPDNSVPDPESSQLINLVVKDMDGEELTFRMRKITELKKLMNSYCEKLSLDPGAIHFLFDGKTIKPHHTPKMLEMEDGDQIHAMLPQTGGGGRANSESPSSSPAPCFLKSHLS